MVLQLELSFVLPVQHHVKTEHSLKVYLKCPPVSELTQTQWKVASLIIITLREFNLKLATVNSKLFVCEASCKGSMETLRTFMECKRKAGELWAAPGPWAVSVFALLFVFCVSRLFSIVFPTSSATLNSS